MVQTTVCQADRGGNVAVARCGVAAASEEALGAVQDVALFGALSSTASVRRPRGGGMILLTEGEVRPSSSALLASASSTLRLVMVQKAVPACWRTR
jgi:hypothetical protein